MNDKRFEKSTKKELKIDVYIQDLVPSIQY